MAEAVEDVGDVEDVGGCGRMWEDVEDVGGVWGWRVGDVAEDVEDVGGGCVRILLEG